MEHEVLPSVLTAAAALDPLAPLVQEPDLRPGDPLAGTNILRERSYGWGDTVRRGQILSWRTTTRSRW